MSIESEMSRIEQNVYDALAAVSEHSVEVTSGANSNELPSLIRSIPKISNIPSYHYVEVARVAEKIRTWKKTHPNNLVFGAISDIHVFSNDTTYGPKSETAIRHAAFALETVGAMGEADFIANLGDLCWENGIDTANAFEGAEYAVNVLKSAFNRMTRYSLVGNHDKSDDTQKQYGLIGSVNVFDAYPSTKIRGFGYKDFSDKKVRVIVLNTNDYLNASGGCALSYEQKDFLMSALDLSGKSDYADWQILLLSHIPLDWNGGDYNFYADLQAIFNAYEDGTSASITVNSAYALNETPSNYATYSGGNLVYNYSGKNAAKIIANVHGHVHTNRVSKVVNTNIVRVATANTNPTLNKSESYSAYGDYSISADEAEKIVKVAGTEKDTAVTFYCIDLDERIIYAFGYGADIDRTIPYKEVSVYAVTYHLTDVISNNSSTSAIEGTTFTTTLSVDTDFAFDTVSVTMGGVDITATAYADGVITIEEVTGDITITATAVDNYEPHWDIANRTQIAISASASSQKSINRKHYYVGASSMGSMYGAGGYISGLSVNGNDVTFTSDSKDVGIGLPYHLEPGTTYTFSAKATASARLRWCYLNADGTYGNQQGYSSSGTSLTTQITAPTDKTMWVMIILDTNTVGTNITYTDISFTKN